MTVDAERRPELAQASAGDCIGADGTGHKLDGTRCLRRPCAIVAGDPTCNAHLGSVVQRRMEETQGPVAVWYPSDPASSYDLVATSRYDEEA